MKRTFEANDKQENVNGRAGGEPSPKKFRNFDRKNSEATESAKNSDSEAAGFEKNSEAAGFGKNSEAAGNRKIRKKSKDAGIVLRSQNFAPKFFYAKAFLYNNQREHYPDNFILSVAARAYQNRNPMAVTDLMKKIFGDIL